jgi:hypothetical protein
MGRSGGKGLGFVALAGGRLASADDAKGCRGGKCSSNGPRSGRAHPPRSASLGRLGVSAGHFA